MILYFFSIFFLPLIGLYILFTVHSLTLFRQRSAIVFPEGNGLQRQSSVPSRCRCRCRECHALPRKRRIAAGSHQRYFVMSNRRCVTRLTPRTSLEEQKLPTLPGHLSSYPVFSVVPVTRSSVLYVCFVDRCLSFCTFSFDHCVVSCSSIYGF